MPFTRPIILIENDPEDQELITEAYESLNQPFPLKVFDNGEHAFNYLRDRLTTPFLIISDINMPGMNGFELRDQVLADETLREKCTPYIFLTDGISFTTSDYAYKRCVQGLFSKPQSSKELRQLLSTIIDYWRKAILPAQKMN